MRSREMAWRNKFGRLEVLGASVRVLVLAALFLGNGTTFLECGSASCLAADQLAADAAYNAAAAMTDSGEYTMARDAWLEFLKAFPNDSQLSHARYHLGVCLYRLKDFNGASEQFAFAAQDGQFPDRADALYFQALSLFEKASLQLGRQISTPKKDVTNTLAERKEEPLPETKKLYENAIRLFRQLIREFPQNKQVADANYFLGVCFQKLGYDDEAQELLKKVAANAQCAYQNQARYALAEIHLNRKKPESEEALRLLDQVLAAKPDTALHARALRLRADVLYQLNRYDEAAKAFAEFFGNEAFAGYLKPEAEDKAIVNVANAYYRYGETLVTLGRDSEAIPYFEFVLQNYQNTLNVPYANYQMALAMQRLNEAARKANPSAKLPYSTDKIVDLWQSILEDPQTQRDNNLRVRTIHHLVQHDLRSGEPAKALALLNRVSEQTQETLLILDKAQTLERLQRTDEAIEQYRRAFSLYSTKANTRNLAVNTMYQIVRLHNAQGNFEQVLETVNELTQWAEFPQVSEELQAAVLHEKASALYQLHQFQAARELWLELATRFPKHPHVHVWMTWTAYAMMNAKDYPAMADFLTKYLQSETARENPLLQVELNHLLGACFLQEAKTLAEEARTPKLASATQALETAYGLLDFTQEDGAGNANQPAEANAAATTETGKVPFRQYNRAEFLLYDLAEANLLQKNHARCEAVLLESLRVFAGSKEQDKSAFLLGQCLVEQEKYAEANDVFQNLAKQFPSSRLSPKALFAASQCCLKLGRTQDAIELTTRSEKEFQQEGLGQRGANVRAQAAMEANDFDTALAAWKEIYASELPEMQALRADALFGIGFCELQKGHFQEAENALAKLLNETPDWVYAERAYVFLIKAMLAQKAPVENGAQNALRCEKLPEAEALLKTMEQKYPQSAFFHEASYLTGLTLFSEGRFDAAIPHFEKARSEDWKDAVNLQATSKQAWALFHQNKLGETAQFTNQMLEKIVIATDFTDEQKQAVRALQAELRYLLGASLFEMKQDAKTDSALECLLQVLNGEDLTEPFRQNAVELVVQIYENRSQWNDVLTWTDHFTRKYPGSAGAARVLYKRAFAQYALKQLEQAEFTCREVLKTSDKLFISKALFLLGEIQLTQKQWEEAVKTFYKVVYGLNEPTLQANALYETARCFEAMNKPEQAKKHFQQLVKQFPESDKAEIAKKKLAEME